ncbi:MAG: hypothetical protein ABR591_03235 [Candidatus Velthaea sp.]
MPVSRAQYVVPSDFSKMSAGTFIASAAVPQPDGSLRALEIHLFPNGFKPGEGSRRYDLVPQSTMNDAAVGRIDAPVANVETRTLTLKFKDGDKRLIVPKRTPVAQYVPADLKALVSGAHVSISAQRDGDGPLTAVAVAVGKDGYVPPM